LTYVIDQKIDLVTIFTQNLNQQFSESDLLDLNQADINSYFYYFIRQEYINDGIFVD
jgi:hypothetical protein